jgi:predicted NAD/FAD-binding protein
MKVAIVGGGSSGLVSAYLLSQRHEVTMFEADSRLGGHTHTVDVEVDGECHAVDTGFIVYNEATYPLFVRLLERLGVETQPSDMSFGVACERTGLEWGSRSVRGILAQPSNLVRPSFIGMLRDVARFNREAPELLVMGDEKLTLGDYLEGSGYGRSFIDHYIIAMGAAVWSAGPSDFLRFPAAAFVRFFANHGLLSMSPDVPWRVIRGGSYRYLDKIVAPFASRVRLSQRVRGLRRRLAGGVELLCPDGPECFDSVVLALHGDQALALHQAPTDTERKLLGSIAYQDNDVVLHTDTSVLPRRNAAWASWNYRIPREAQDRVFVSYDMNRLQSLESRHRFLVTLNAPEGRIAPERVLGRYQYAHPVFDARALKAQALHETISGSGGVHYCGAYWGYGFHEDGVQSAVKACQSFGVGL